jgi:predicted site-specific integrase-resolvase
VSSDTDRRVNLAVAVSVTGVSIRTLYYWMTTGRLPFVKRGQPRFVRVSDVLTLKTLRKEPCHGDR